MGQKLKPERCLAWIRRHHPTGSFRAQEVVSALGISRQTAARVLGRLIAEGKIHRTGSTKAARYQLGKAKARQPSLRKIASLKGLSEQDVYEEILLRWPGPPLPENTSRIFSYAFTEMLNNAIDHSRSVKAEIEAGVRNERLFFSIRDRGVGLFLNIKRAFALDSEESAVEHLLKGKQTTAPEAHSGQGIFFTSKIADLFEIRSHKLTLIFDNQAKDVRLREARFLKGTEVRFALQIRARKTLKTLFDQYANDDFEFDRTTYPVIVLKQTGAISRSQAKRLTVGLDAFDRVIFDFKNVKELGQGFADEIFRIFQKQRPHMILETRNANAAVHFMIERSKRG